MTSLEDAVRNVLALHPLHICSLQVGDAAGHIHVGWSTGSECSHQGTLAGEKSSSDFPYGTGEELFCLGHLVCRMGIVYSAFQTGSGAAVG